MKFIKKFDSNNDIQNYMNTNFVSPHLFSDNNHNIDYFESYEQLEYISSTKTGGQYINLDCKLFENDDDIKIDIKFNLKGGGKNYELATLQKPSVLLAAVSEIDPWFAFVLRKNDQQTNANDSDYVHFYTKWEISNSIYTFANGDKDGKNKYYATYMAGNISGYEQTPTNQIYEKTFIIDNLAHMGLSGTKLERVRNLPTYMFAVYDEATSNNEFKGQMWRFSESDVYYCKITKGTTVIRDLIPLKRKSDNTVGLYDKISKRFFISQGDDPFVAGPTI